MIDLRKIKNYSTATAAVLFDLKVNCNLCLTAVKIKLNCKSILIDSLIMNAC
jgi:hypothetical protein